MRQLASDQGATVKSVHQAKSSKSISYAVFSSKSLSTDQLIAKFQGRSDVVAVSPNNYVHISTVPNDPGFSDQWEMQNSSDTDIDAPEAWDLTTGSSDVVVAVVDTGVAYTHVDLKDNVWINPGEIAGNGIDDDGNGYVDDVHGIDAVGGTSDPWDTYGHGTHVAGTIAAEGNNGIGIAGVSWKTKIMPLRFIDSSGYGTDAGAIACINYAIDMKLNHGVNLVAINASWGGGYPDTALENAIQAAGNAGIVFCAAAGNNPSGVDIDSAPEYPAAYPCTNIISVGASDSADKPAYFSNYGAANVDLFAPGTNILSTYIDSTYTAPTSNDILYDGMQAGGGNWTPSGTWAITDELPKVPGDGNLSWSDSPGGDYTNWEDSSLTSRVIDLSKADPRDTMLSFYLSSNLQQGPDVLYVEGSVDGANWTFLSSYTGIQKGTFDISLPAELLDKNFQLRFRLYTDGSITADGVHLDDIGIASVPPNTYASWQGTSMATPHVTGTVALLAALSPSDSVATRIDRILSNVDQVPSLSGECVTGGRLNAAKALQTCVVVTGVAPSSGLTWGGTNIVITGINFTDVTGVTVGGAPATSYTVDSPTQISAVVPAHVAGKADVVVATSTSGTSGTAGIADNYTYVSPTHIEQNDLRLDYLGTWAGYSNPVFSGGSYFYTNQTGSSVMAAFTGTQLHLISRKGAVFGIANISVDGGAPVSVNLYSATDQYKQDVWSTGVLASGLHTVRITCSGQKDAAATNTYIGVDAVETDGTFSTVTNAQQNDSRLSYLGAWSGYSNAVFLGGSYAYSQSAGASVTVPFNGQKLDWIAARGPIFGIANVSVDGGAATKVDLYAPTAQYRQDVYSTGVLTNGLHTVTISYSGGKDSAATATIVNADAFEVVGGVASATRFEQTDSRFVWQKTWSLGSGSYYSGGSYRYVNTSGASVTINFNGISLYYIAQKAPNMGKVSVSVDGKPATIVDLYASSTYYKQTVFSTGILAPGNHTVKISWTGQRRYIGSGSNTINIDAVGVIGTLR